MRETLFCDYSVAGCGGYLLRGFGAGGLVGYGSGVVPPTTKGMIKNNCNKNIRLRFLCDCSVAG